MSENLVVSGVSNEMSEESTERTRRSATTIMLSLILSGSLAPGMLGQTLLGPLLLAPVVSMATQTKAQAQSQTYEGLPIKSITVDANKQLVIVFDAGGSFPTQPIISELDTPHRLSLDFPNAVLDLSTLPSADALTARLSEAIPGVSAVRLSTVKSQREPIARIVLEFNEGINNSSRSKSAGRSSDSNSQRCCHCKQCCNYFPLLLPAPNLQLLLAHNQPTKTITISF